MKLYIDSIFEMLETDESRALLKLNRLFHEKPWLLSDFNLNRLQEIYISDDSLISKKINFELAEREKYSNSEAYRDRSLFGLPLYDKKIKQGIIVEFEEHFEAKETFNKVDKSFTYALNTVEKIISLEFPRVKLKKYVIGDNKLTIEGNSVGLLYWIILWSDANNLKFNIPIAATGTVDEKGNIQEVDHIQAKVKAAIRAGFKYIFIPESCCLDSHYSECSKVIPVSNTHAVKQWLLHIDRNKLAQNRLTQFLIGVNKNKSHLKEDIETILEKENSVFDINIIYNKFRLEAYYALNSSNDLFYSWFYEFNSVIQEKISDPDNGFVFQLGLLNALFSESLWFAYLPLFIWILNSKKPELAMRIYNVNSAKFFDHNSVRTISARLARVLYENADIDLWKDDDFRDKYNLIIGLAFYDAINATSFLLSFNNRTFLEEQMLELLLKGITSENNFKFFFYDGEEYWKVLREAIKKAVPEYHQRKFRRLRHDQRIGKILVIIHKIIKVQKVELKKYLSGLFKLIQYHFEHGVNGDNYFNKLSDLKEFLFQENYIDVKGLEKMLAILNQDEAKKIPLYSVKSHLQYLLSVNNSYPEKPRFSLRENINKLSNDNAKDNDIFQAFTCCIECQSQWSLPNSYNEKIITQPALFFVSEFLFKHLNSDYVDIVDWFAALKTWSSENDNITAIQLISLVVAHWSGVVWAKNNADLDFPTIFGIRGEKVNKFILSFLIGFYSIKPANHVLEKVEFDNRDSNCLLPLLLLKNESLDVPEMFNLINQLINKTVVENVKYPVFRVVGIEPVRTIIEKNWSSNFAVQESLKYDFTNEYRWSNYGKNQRTDRALMPIYKFMLNPNKFFCEISEIMLEPQYFSILFIKYLGDRHAVDLNARSIKEISRYMDKSIEKSIQTTITIVDNWLETKDINSLKNLLMSDVSDVANANILLEIIEKHCSVR